jgi:hypothetical protein
MTHITRSSASFSRGAHHHIFSTSALGHGDEVRRIVTADPTQADRRMSRNENRQTTLQFAVRMNRLEMVQLLLELGADPIALDGAAMSVAIYARSTDADRPGDWQNASRLPCGDATLLNSGVLHEMAKRGDARAARSRRGSECAPSALERQSHGHADIAAMITAR